VSALRIRVITNTCPLVDYKRKRKDMKSSDTSATLQ